MPFSKLCLATRCVPSRCFPTSWGHKKGAFCHMCACHAFTFSQGCLLHNLGSATLRPATCTCHTCVPMRTFAGFTSHTGWFLPNLHMPRVAFPSRVPPPKRWPCHVLGSSKGGFFQTCACHALMSSEMSSSTVAPATRCLPITGPSSQTLALPRYRFL